MWGYLFVWHTSCLHVVCECVCSVQVIEPFQQLIGLYMPCMGTGCVLCNMSLCVLKLSWARTATMCKSYTSPPVCLHVGLSNFCLSCGHGGHALHLQEWFRKHTTCPTGCGCRCLDSSLQMIWEEMGSRPVVTYSASGQCTGTILLFAFLLNVEFEWSDMHARTHTRTHTQSDVHEMCWDITGALMHAYVAINWQSLIKSTLLIWLTSASSKW